MQGEFVGGPADGQLVELIRQGLLIAGQPARKIDLCGRAALAFVFSGDGTARSVPLSPALTVRQARYELSEATGTVARYEFVGWR